MKLQDELRSRVVAWLAKAENAEHHCMGWSTAPLECDESVPTTFKTPPPSLPSEMDVHRKSGTYATVPCLRALAEILHCIIIFLDSSSLFDPCRCSCQERRRRASYAPGAPSSRRCSAATPAPAPAPVLAAAAAGAAARPRRVLGCRSTMVRSKHPKRRASLSWTPLSDTLYSALCHVVGLQGPGAKR